MTTPRDGFLPGIRRYRGVILIVIISFSLTGYVYLNPPVAQKVFVNFGFPGDLNIYASRFLLSTLFFGIVPMLAALLMGYGLEDLGLVWRRGMFRWSLYWLAFPVFVLVIAASAFDGKMAAFYPFSKTLLSWSIDRSLWYQVLHSFSYLLFYYLPWEVLFRGLMVLPLVTHVENRQLAGQRANKGAVNRGLKRVPLIRGRNDQQTMNSWKDPVLLTIAALQTIPTVLIHFAHPLSETLGTAVFGVIAAVVVLRTRSIIPVILLHATAGILLDTVILIRNIV